MREHVHDELPDALAAACEALEAERVALPATLASPPLIDRVRGHTPAEVD